MALVIDFIDETEKLSQEEIVELEKLLIFAAESEKLEGDAELSVAFVDNEQIQQLNNDYRNKNVPTDVLSFAMEEDEDDFEFAAGEVGMPRILGDIIISLEKTVEQAEQYEHSFMRELGFLTVHGFLHLLGYDHETDEDEHLMFTKQKEILDKYGLTR